MISAKSCQGQAWASGPGPVGQNVKVILAIFTEASAQQVLGRRGCADLQSNGGVVAHGLLAQLQLQVLKLSLLSRECSGEGVHADLHMSCKLY